METVWTIIWLAVLGGIVWWLAVRTRLGLSPSQDIVHVHTEPEVSRVIVSVLQQYDELSERDLGAIEGELLKYNPRSKERHLIYALRVSKGITTMTTISKLPERWRTAHLGVRGCGGILSADDGPSKKAVVELLEKRYRQRLHGLASGICEKNLLRIAKAKSNHVRRKLLEDTERTVIDAATDFTPCLPGAFEDARQMVDTFVKLTKCEPTGQPIEDDVDSLT